MSKVEEYLIKDSEVGGEPVPPMPNKDVLDYIKRNTTKTVIPSGSPCFGEGKFFKYLENK